MSATLQTAIDEAFRSGAIVPCPGVTCGYAASRLPRAPKLTIVCGWCSSRYELESIEGVRVWCRYDLPDREVEHG